MALHKTASRVSVKSADKGEVSVVFSTLNVKDADGDVVVPGAFPPDGTPVVISAYSHASQDFKGGLLPVGRGTLRSTDTEAIMDGAFFMDTTGGRDTFSVVKQLGELQEWSYSLEDVTSEPGMLNGEPVNFVKRIGRVKEVSPTLIGSGVGTRTLEVKSHQGDTAAAPGTAGVIRPHETPVGELPFVKSGFASSVDALRFGHAWVDVTGDPTNPAAYKFAHHDDRGANVRACVMGIATLLSGKHGIPEPDVKGVWEHLAGHLRDADREPVSLTMTQHDAPDGGIVKTAQELSVVLAEVAAVNERIAEVSASRASKGKSLTHAQRELIGWLADELARTKALLNTPTDEAAREFARFVAFTQGVTTP